MIKREITSKIIKQCFRGKVISLIGPRQVGKTTMLKKVQAQLNKNSIWLNADEGDIRTELAQANTSTSLIQLIGQNTELLIIDEAQQIPDIGLKLKLLHDTFNNIQIIATGSSAFELQNKMNESLTGRKRTFNLFPISFEEIVKHKSLIEAKRELNHRMIYGSYPEVINNIGEEKEILNELTESYLFKDIIKIEGIRKPKHIEKIVRALALQVGSEVSFNELSKLVGNIDNATVEKYIGLLEKAFVIYQLPAFSKNQRNEIKKGKKYYFYDNGIRNTIINNYSPLELRIDKGSLWENYLITERIKFNRYNNNKVNSFFWRTKDQAEIDYIEEIDGFLHAYEFKWQNKKSKLPKSFKEYYPNHTFKLIHKENYQEFISSFFT